MRARRQERRIVSECALEAPISFSSVFPNSSAAVTACRIGSRAEYVIAGGMAMTGKIEKHRIESMQ